MVARPHSVGQLAYIGKDLRALSPSPVDVGVSEDGQKPSSGVLSVETIYGFECSQQRLLDEVLGTGGLVGEGECDSVEKLNLGDDISSHRLMAELCADLNLHTSRNSWAMSPIPGPSAARDIGPGRPPSNQIPRRRKRGRIALAPAPLATPASRSRRGKTPGPIRQLERSSS